MCVYKNIPINTESIILSYLNIYDIICLQRCTHYDVESKKVLANYKHKAFIEKYLDCIENIVLETNICYTPIDKLHTHITDLLLYMYVDKYSTVYVSRSKIKHKINIIIVKFFKSSMMNNHTHYTHVLHEYEIGSKLHDEFYHLFDTNAQSEYKKWIQVMNVDCLV